MQGFERMDGELLDTAVGSLVPAGGRFAVLAAHRAGVFPDADYAVRTVVEETGVLRGRRRRAVDSTILADAVATQDTVTQLVSAIRRVAREVPGAAGQIAAVCTGHDYSGPGKPKIDWDDPAAKNALVSAPGKDAKRRIGELAGAELDQDAACAVALLALVAGQD